MRKKFNSKSVQITEKDFEENVNSPSKTLRRFIKLANLENHKVNLGEDIFLHDLLPSLSPSNFFSQYGLDQCIEKNHLHSHPKLCRYLSFIARQKNSNWTTALENFQNARKFLRIFVSIAEEYQEYLNAQIASEKKSKQIFADVLHSLNEDDNLIQAELKKHEERQLLLSQLSKFRLSYSDAKNSKNISLSGNDRLKVFHSQQSHRYHELIKQLYEVAFVFVSIDVENHYANISLGEYLNVIQGTDLRRLKRCIVCQNILWAKPLNKKFCTTGCANIQLQRNLRANEERRNKVNFQRRNNYSTKKKMKKNRVNFLD